MEERIRTDGRVLPGAVLKVDSFLNHQLDVGLLRRLGKELAARYAGEGVNKLLTVETSGIAVAVAAAEFFRCGVVFAKKSKSRNSPGTAYTAQVESYTRGGSYEIAVSREFLGPRDRVVLIDDFLASGSALRGLLQIARQAGAEVAGAGICIEKVFQGGGAQLRAQGLRIESLARIGSMGEDGSIRFC